MVLLGNNSGDIAIKQQIKPSKNSDMIKVTEPKAIRSFDKFNSILSEKNLLCLHAMISVRGGDGGEPIILPPPPPTRP